MEISKLRSAALQLLTDAAGKDGALTKTEAKKLPAYMRERVDALRSSPSAKVSVNDAYGAVWSELGTDLYQAQGGKYAKGPTNLSAGELQAFNDASLKDVTQTLWSIAEAAAPENRALTPVKKADLVKAANLMIAIIKKADNGDDVMTPVELTRAAVAFKGQRDTVMQAALMHAINNAKNSGDRTVEGVVKVIEAAKGAVLALNKNGDSTLSPEELGRARRVIDQALISVAEQRPGAKVSDYTVTPEKIYVPSRPFRAPPNATAAAYVQALTEHFDAFSNDNKGAGARNISRYVMGEVETAGMAKEIAKLPLSFRKAVLKALEARVQQNPNEIGDPQRIYFTPQAEPLLAKLAKDAHVSCNFKGVARPPQFDYY